MVNEGPKSISMDQSSRYVKQAPKNCDWKPKISDSNEVYSKRDPPNSVGDGGPLGTNV